MTIIEKNIDVLEPTGSRRRFVGYAEIANAETADFYNLKEHVLDRLYIGLAAIDNDDEITNDERCWGEVKTRLTELIQDIERNC